VRARDVGQLLLGLALVGVSIAGTVQAGLGLSPWDVLHQGLSRHTGVPIGTVGILVGVVILLLWFPLRQRPGIGTVLNVVVIGLTIDAVLAHTSPVDGLPRQIALLAVSVPGFAVGIGLYLGVELGPGPRDGLMTGLHRRFGWSIRLSRTLIEVSALVAGIALGGTAGVGTVFLAFGIGPMAQVTLRWFGYEGRRVEELAEGPARAIGLSGE
jgi:uncharacterized membrane protein YczE